MSASRTPKVAPDLAAVLHQLGQQMEAAHLSPDHPWRVLIAETLAAHLDAAAGTPPVRVAQEGGAA